LQFRRTPPFESNCCGVLDGGMRMLRVVFNCMPKVIDKYVLEEVIGKGQFGEVFRGRHQDTLQVVAIKSIRRDMIKGMPPLMQVF
jgi:serine/threonine protein kinase